MRDVCQDEKNPGRESRMSYGNPTIPTYCKFCKGPVLYDPVPGAVQCITHGCQASYIWPGVPNLGGPQAPDGDPPAEPGLTIPGLADIVKAMTDEWGGGSFQDLVKNLESRHGLVIRRKPNHG